MREFINRILERIQTFYKGLDKNRKILLYVGTGVLIIALTFGILILTRTDYVVIAQGLSPADAQIVTGQLDDQEGPLVFMSSDIQCGKSGNRGTVS